MVHKGLKAGGGGAGEVSEQRPARPRQSCRRGRPSWATAAGSGCCHEPSSAQRMQASPCCPCRLQTVTTPFAAIGTNALSCSLPLAQGLTAWAGVSSGGCACGAICCAAAAGTVAAMWWTGSCGRSGPRVNRVGGRTAPAIEGLQGLQGAMASRTHLLSAGWACCLGEGVPAGSPPIAGS